MKFPEDPPFRISGGATVWHLDKLYLIGGYTVQYNKYNTIIECCNNTSQVEYDCELKSFYQSPVSCVWMFEPVVGKWSMGPPLPKESFVTTDKKIRFRGYSLGKYK